MNLSERIESLLFLALFALAFAFAVVVLCCGCVDVATRTAEQAANNKVQILLNDAKNSAKLATEKAKEAREEAEAAGKAADEAARENPFRHPIRAMEQIVKDTRPYFIAGAVIFSFAALGLLGATLASGLFSFLSAYLVSLFRFLAIVCGTIAIGCWALLYAGPVGPEIFLVILGIGVAVLLVKLHNDKWDIGKLFDAHAANADSIKSIATQTGATVPGSPWLSTITRDAAGPGSQGQPLAP